METIFIWFRFYTLNPTKQYYCTRVQRPWKLKAFCVNIYFILCLINLSEKEKISQINFTLSIATL